MLGGLNYLIPVIKKAKKLGLYVITCDYKPQNIAHKFADEYHNISILEKEGTIISKKTDIDGIMSFAMSGVLTAAYVGHKWDFYSRPIQIN